MTQPWPVVLASLLTAAPLVARAGALAGSAIVTSDYAYRGLTQSEHIPALIVDGHYGAESGLFAGLGASLTGPHRGAATSGVIEPYLGYQRALGADFSARVLGVHHDQYGPSQYSQYRYDEFIATLGAFGRVFASAAVSPDNGFHGRTTSVSGRRSLAFDLALHQPLAPALSLNLGVGDYDLHPALHDSFLYWNAGLAWTHGRVGLDLSYIGTDGRARHLLDGGAAVNRLVGSVLLRF